MQNTVLKQTPSFDFRAFVAWSARDHLARPSHCSAFSAEEAPARFGRPASAERETLEVRRPVPPGWIVELHIAAARRWLACVPARPSEVEASLRSIVSASASSHPAVARDLLNHPRDHAAEGGLSSLLDRLSALAAAKD